MAVSSERIWGAGIGVGAGLALDVMLPGACNFIESAQNHTAFGLHSFSEMFPHQEGLFALMLAAVPVFWGIQGFIEGEGVDLEKLDRRERR